MPAAIHGFLLLPVKAHHIRMADAMDTRDLIAAALVPVEVEGCLQGTVPDILSDAERLRHSPAILDGIGSGPRPVAEIQPGKRNVPVREQRRRTGKDGSPLFILQDERIRLRSRRKGDFGVGRTISGMGERDLPFRDIPAFVMVRLNLLQFQPVKVNGHVLLPDRAVEARRGLGDLETSDTVAPEIVDFPKDLHPSALGNVQVRLPGGTQDAVRLRSVHEAQGETDAGILRGMDVCPERDPVVAAPVLRLVEFQGETVPAALFGTERTPRSTVFRCQDIRAVHEGETGPERLLPVMDILPGITDPGIPFQDRPSAGGFHVVHQAGGKDLFLRPAVQHGILPHRLLPATGQHRHEGPCEQSRKDLPHFTRFTPLGSFISEETLPSAFFVCRTEMTPYGVGKVPSAHSRLPRCGWMRTSWKPTPTGSIPSTCSLSQLVGPEAQPWQKLWRRPT